MSERKSTWTQQLFYSRFILIFIYHRSHHQKGISFIPLIYVPPGNVSELPVCMPCCIITQGIRKEFHSVPDRF
jgi:hypothetical protein